MKMKLTLAAIVIALTSTYTTRASAQYVVQIPVDSILDGRAVITLTGGTVVPFGNKQGIYSGGTTGYATAAVQMMLAPTSKGVGLPDDGLFPATGNLPPFQLHFSNAAPATSPQTLQLPATGAAGTQTFQFPVPPATYTSLYLILASGDGTASFTVTLSYAGGTPSTMTTITNLPDSGMGVETGGPPHFYIVTNTGKWSNTNTDLEPTGHTIEGIEITPSPAPAVLTGVTLAKTNGAILVFWGATGIATTPVDAGVVTELDSGSADDASFDSAASSGTSSGASSGTGISSGASSTGSATTGSVASGVASGAVSSGVSGSSGSNTTGAGGSSGTTTSGTPGGSSGGGSASGGSAPPSSSDKSGCSMAPSSPRTGGAAWASLAALGLLVRVGRRGGRRSGAAKALS